MSRPSRNERRRIDRRADKLLARLRGHAMLVPSGITPRDGVVLLAEGLPPIIVPRKLVQPLSRICGAEIDGLDGLLEEIAADPRDDGTHWPVFIRIDDGIEVAFQGATILPITQGGEA